MTVEVKDTMALERLRKRIDNPPKQIDNNSLHAGSPMYFYCKMCAGHSDTMPESYTGSPNQFCGHCLELRTANPEITYETLVELAKALKIS